MIAVNHAPLKGSGHAKNGGSRHPGYGGSSAMLDDALLSATALCAEIATGDLAELARAGDFSASWASEIRRNGGKGSFIHKTTVLAFRLAGRNVNAAWALVAHFKATLKQALLPVNNSDLVARFWELQTAESEAEGRENKAQAEFARTGDLEALERATTAEAAIQEELAAVCRELRQRRIDPRTHRA